MSSKDFADVRERVEDANAWYGVNAPANAAQLVIEHAAPGLSAPADSYVARNSWWLVALRVARDAAIGLLLMASVPLALIAVRGEDAVRRGGDGRERLVEVDALRPLRVARQGTLTPVAAGHLLYTLHSTAATPNRTTAIAMQPVAASSARPWVDRPMSPDLFATLRAEGNDGTLARSIVLAAERGFSDAELAYLRVVADAPFWRELERVVSAPAVDVIGGRYVIPFSADASVHDMPILRFQDTKQLAHAGVSRAAYYVATGRRAEAEQALRVVLSYGFVLVDNASHALDALIGRAVIGIAQNGLEQLYTVSGNTKGLAMVRSFETSKSDNAGSFEGRSSASGAVDQLVQEAGDASLPRAVRMEALHRLTFASCGSVRGVLTGPPPAVRGAFARARTELARFPSERAYLNLLERSEGGSIPPITSGSILDELAMGAATATSAVFGVPQVAACTRMVLAD